MGANEPFDTGDAGAKKPKTILLVEDEALIAMSEAGLLQERGYNVITARNADEAIDLAHNREIDLILMDIDLGEGKKDGTEAAEIILKKKELPIVFLSSHGEKAYVERVKKITGYGYVLKNAGEFVLIESINMAFELFTAHQKTKKSEQRFRAIADYTYDWEDWIGTDGKLIWVNPGVERITGYTPEECYEMDDYPFCLIHENDLDISKDDIYHSLMHKTSRQNREFQCACKDGTYKWISVNWQPIYDADGRHLGTRSSMRDITERKVAEEKLRQVTERAPLGFVYIDKDLKVVYQNPQAREMMGVPEGENESKAMHRNIRELKSMIETGRLAELQKLPRGEEIELTTPFTSLYGKKTVLHLHAVPTFQNDVFDGAIAMLEDITERLQTEEALRESREKSEEHRLFWEGVFHSSSDAIVALDNENRIAGWNYGAERLFEYTAEEAFGKNVDELITGRDEDMFGEAESITRQTLDGSRVPDMETVRYRKDGTPVHVRIAGSPIIINGDVYGVVGIYSDITKRKQAEEKLQKSLEEKDYLMKELNHRVKNNLAIISSLMNLKDSSLGDEIDLSDLRNQVDAIRIIHEKLYQGNEIQYIDVKDYIQELLETVFSSFTIQPINITADIEDISISTKRAVSLGLIINEIATNAIKHGFAPDQEARFSIDLAQDRPAGWYSLSLSNSGRPFPEDIGLKNPGTLGLRLITALVDQLRGTIDLQRRPHPVFTIRFPIEEEI
jgi:PAS domain S-box-containing protein